MPGDHSGFSNVPGEQLGAGSVRSIIQTLDISPSVVAGRLGMTSNTLASPLDALDILERSFKCPFCREVTATWAWMLAGRCLGRVVICCDSSPPRVPKGPTVPVQQVLKRMCRSLYRYPDPEAAELAKKTLQEIRHLDATTGRVGGR